MNDTTYIIEGQDATGHWSAETVGSLVVEYQTEAAAEEAIDDLVRTLGWQREQLRVVSQ